MRRRRSRRSLRGGPRTRSLLSLSTKFTLFMESDTQAVDSEGPRAAVKLTAHHSSLTRVRAAPLTVSMNTNKLILLPPPPGRTGPALLSCGAVTSESKKIDHTYYYMIAN